METFTPSEAKRNVRHEASKKGPSLKLDRFLLVLSALQVALFGALAWRMRKHPVFPIDVKITSALQKHRSSFWRYLAITLSYLGGSPAIVNVLIIPVAATLWKLRLRLEAAMTISLPLTSTLARALMKRLVKRPRPNPLLVHVYKRKRTKSFPSGDVTSSVTFWGWLFALGMYLSRGKRSWQKALASLPALFVVLVGPARIYLGVHWASDVLGAYLFGGSWLALSLRLYLALRNRKMLTQQEQQRSK